MIIPGAGLGWPMILDGVRRLNHDAMLERCHVSTCLHNLAFMAEMGPLCFAILLLFPLLIGL